MSLFGKSDQELDTEMEKELSTLFKRLEAEQDPERKKMILGQIQSVQDAYKQQKQKKAKWRIFS